MGENSQYVGFMSTPTSTFASRVQADLIKRDRSYAWLARQTAIPESSLNGYLNGYTDVPLSRATKIASFLGIPLATDEEIAAARPDTTYGLSTTTASAA